MISIRELTIDPPSHRVSLGNNEVILTHKEFELLHFFASHPNQVFSKDHLFEKIWGFDSNGDVATVVVHVQKLRRKYNLQVLFHLLRPFEELVTGLIGKWKNSPSDNRKRPI